MFMAMQVSFADPAGGGAHLGLQHHPRFPDRSAVNWGGYARAGGLLAGSASELRSTPADINTRDFPWKAATPYRLEVRRGRRLADGQWAWIGSVTDADGAKTVVRELFSQGSSMAMILSFDIIENLQKILLGLLKINHWFMRPTLQITNHERICLI